MDLDAGSILASLVVSGVGTVAFLYGKRQSRVPHMALGIVMCIFPYFLSNWIIILLIGAFLCALLYMAVRLGY